jgi:Spy/CpxP family protein refolding chaperone
MRNLKTIIIAVASVAVIGFAINAFAHGGMGWVGGMGHHGQGWHHRGDYGPNYDDQMSKERYKQFEQKREAIFKATQERRPGSLWLVRRSGSSSTCWRTAK